MLALFIYMKRYNLAFNEIVDLRLLVWVVLFVNRYYTFGRWRAKNSENFCTTFGYCKRLLYCLSKFKRMQDLTPEEEFVVIRFYNFVELRADEFDYYQQKIYGFFFSFNVSTTYKNYLDIFYDYDKPLDFVEDVRVGCAIQVLDKIFGQVTQGFSKKPKRNYKHNDIWVSVFGLRFFEKGLFVRFRTTQGYFIDGWVTENSQQQDILEADMHQKLIKINARYSRFSSRFDYGIPTYQDVYVYSDFDATFDEKSILESY